MQFRGYSLYDINLFEQISINFDGSRFRNPAVMLMPESSSEMHELRYRDRQQHQKPSSQIFVNNIDVGVAKNISL